MMTYDRSNGDAMEAATDDPLALPASMHDRLRRLEEARAQHIAALHGAVHARHEARCRGYRSRLMDGQDDLVTYRAHMAQSAAIRAADLADVPPVVDGALLGERVRIRAAEAAAGWWADELAQVEQAQAAWTPRVNEQTAGEEADHGA